jgi:hypothetical protein
MGYAKLKVNDVYDEAVQKSDQYAYECVLSLQLPNTIHIELSDEWSKILGKKFYLIAKHHEEKLIEKYEKNLPALMALALKSSWYACRSTNWQGLRAFTPSI